MLNKSLLIEIVMAVVAKEFDKKTADRAVKIINQDVHSCTEEELQDLSRKYYREVRSIDRMEEEEWYFRRNIDFSKEHMFFVLLSDICRSPKCAVNRLLIANCTQHSPVQEQLDQGVTNPDCWEEIKRLSSFEDIPSCEDMKERASKIAHLLNKEGFKRCLLGGAPYFMSSLECELIRNGIKPLYSFSVRESREEHLSDGSVLKINVFRHKGFIEL